MQKVLLLDIETLPNLAWVWDYYEQNVLQIEKERELACFAYKWKGEKRVNVLSQRSMGLRELVRRLHGVIDEADIIVGHNVQNFDLKMANSFFVEQGMKPPSPYKVIDTLNIARSKFRFNSNHLNDLGSYLGVGSKVEIGGFKLWLGCLKGDKKSWRKMEEYNKGDVVLLEKVYEKLSPWANTPFKKLGMTCPNCGGTKLQSRGWNINKVFMQRRYQCQDCGHWCQSSNKIKHESAEYIK